MSLKTATYDLSAHGPVLATREAGRAAGAEAADQLAANDALVLTFEGVEVASPPFLDEFLRPIHAVLWGGESGRLLAIAGLNEDVRESLEMVLERLGWAIATLGANDVRLLGGKRHLQETLRKAQELGHFTARELADELEVKLPNLHARLKALADAGAVRREEDTPNRRGRGHATYSVPDLTLVAGPRSA